MFRSKVGGVGLALLGVALCRAEVVENPEFKGPKTTVRFSLWGGADEVKQTRELCQRFVAQHPEIRLDVGVYPWGQYWAKVQTQMASGLAPDVMQFYTGSFGVWVARGALYPLDQLAQEDPEDLKDFFPVTLSNCSWDNKLYAMPTDIANWSLVYSIDALEQSGIPNSDWPSANRAMEWDEFCKLTKRLTLRKPDGTTLQYGMSAGQNWNLSMAGKDGGTFVDRPVNPTRSTVLGNESLVKSLVDNFAQQYAERNTLGSKPLASGAFTVNSDNLLMNPKFAMGTTGPWALKELRDAKVNFGVAPLPKGTVENALINVNSVAIYAGCKNPREAWLWVKFLSGSAVSKERASLLGGLPARKSGVEGFLNNKYQLKGAEAFIHELEVSNPTLTADNTEVGKVRDAWLKAVEETFDGEYNQRFAELKRPITPEADKKFAAEMRAFIEKTIRDRLPQLDADLNRAIQSSKVPPVSFASKVIYPALACIALLVAAGGYGFAVARNNRAAEPVTDSRSSKAAYGFLSPWLIGFFAFVLGPILASIYFSFTDWNMIAAPNWVGFQNYLDLAKDPTFYIGLKTTLTYALLAIPISLGGGLFTAALLSSGVRGADLFKALLYFPALFTGAETAVLWTNMLNKDHGVLNYLLSLVHLAPIDWMDSSHAFGSVVMMNLFWVGGSMIIYYAGMKQIPSSYYEAAELDGASPRTKFLRITIPLLSPVILFMVVMTTIGSFQVFTPALFFAGSSTEIGGPGDALRFYSVNIYDAAFNNLKMGQACSYAIILFLIIFLITYLQLKISKRFVFSEGDPR